MIVDSSTLKLDKRYILIDKLGEGSIGTVYRATDRLDKKTVVLKCVTTLIEELLFASSLPTSSTDNDDFYLALGQEFQMLSSLFHPYLIQVLDFGFAVYDGQNRLPYFTMEYVAAPKSITDVGKSLDLQARLNLIIQLLQALVYLHQYNILHRRVKPANIFVDNGKVRLGDFGLAAASKYTNRMTAGTIAYMAPELFQGRAASRASDLYAVGIILYELLAGRHPFNGDDPALLIEAILNIQPDTYAVTDNKALASVLDRLLRKNPAQRYQNAMEAIHELCHATGCQDGIELRWKG